MIGTSLETMGGTSRYAQIISSSPLFRRWNVQYVATHCDGSRAAKAAQATRGWMRFMGLLLSRRVLVLHVLMSSGASFWRKMLFVLPAFATSTPVLLHIHGGGFSSFAAANRWRRGLVRFALERASGVIGLSTRWQTDLQAIAPGAKVHVIPNPAPLPSRMVRPRRSDEILFLGRIGQLKGCYTLLDAVAQLAPRHPELTLVCGGDGDAEELMARAQQLGIGARLRIPGWITGPAKDRLLARATLFALPSHVEGLPMALLEAMAAGMPIVTTPVGGIPDAVRDGIEASLVPPGDVDALAAAIDRLLVDEALRVRLGAAAQSRVEQEFGLARVSAQLDALYSQLHAGCGAAPSTAIG